jgi:hypothetical protein
MSHSRIRFVHVVKGIAKEQLYVCRILVGLRKTGGGGEICEGPLVLTAKLKVSFFCSTRIIVLSERMAVLFCSGTSMSLFEVTAWW